MNKSFKRGFTIVELLVVIVVIGILASITIVSYTGISSRAVASSMQTDLANAIKQLKLYQVDNSSYPTSNDCSGGTNPLPPKICFRASTGNVFNYQYDNAANPPSFTLAISNTNGSSYYATQSKSVTAGSQPVASPATYIVGANDRAIYAYATTYAAIQSATTATLQPLAEYDLIIGQYKMAYAGQDYNLRRVVMPIDTSGLPDDAVISSAVLSMRGYGDYSATDFDITAVSYTGSDPSVAGDIDNFGTTSYGTLNTSTWTNSGYNNLSLNATGIAAINKTGTTFIGLRSSRDIAQISPTGDEYIYPYAADKGVGYAPYLTVTFTQP